MHSKVVCAGWRGSREEGGKTPPERFTAPLTFTQVREDLVTTQTSTPQTVAFAGKHPLCIYWMPGIVLGAGEQTSRVTCYLSWRSLVLSRGGGKLTLTINSSKKIQGPSHDVCSKGTMPWEGSKLGKMRESFVEKAGKSGRGSNRIPQTALKELDHLHFAMK